MKAIRIKSCLILMIYLFPPSAMAQLGVVSSAGEAFGTTGRISYTVGQVFCSIQTGHNGTAVQGLQQPYEISVVTGIDDVYGFNMKVNVFPNPASDILTIKVETSSSIDLPLLGLNIFGINGRLLLVKNLSGCETKVHMTDYLPGVYFFNVLDLTSGANEKIIKTIQIIKY